MALTVNRVAGADIDMYPGFFRRSIAMLVDLIVVVACIAYAVSFPIFPGVPWAKVVVLLAVPLLYEPLLSAYACTIGQTLTWTRIRDAETMKRMSLKQTYIRFLIRYVATTLGGLGSVGSGGAAPTVSMFPRGDDRAVHDLEAGTVVISASAA